MVWYDRLLHDDPALLTTGEAAALIGSSRQHILDLCRQGRLRYVRTSGGHRRIGRDDVERLAHRPRGSRSMRREELRSLWIHRALAAAVARDPERALALGRKTLAYHWREHPEAAPWLRRWDRLVDAGPEAVMAMLTSPSAIAVELRQNTPFPGLLSDRERVRVIAAFARYWRSRSEGRT